MPIGRWRIALFHTLYRNLPGQWGERVRRRHFPATAGRPKRVGKACKLAPSRLILGEEVELGEHVRIYGDVAVGARTIIEQYVSLWAIGGPDRHIEIGEDCILEPGVSIMAQMHEHRDPNTPIREQGARGGPVSIGSDVLLGRLAIILPDLSIADGAVVTPGSVVTKDVESYAVMRGVPAEVIGFRK